MEHPAPREHIQFLNGCDILTLWVEKRYEPEGFVLGWCPELENNIVVHPENVVQEAKA